MVDTKRRNVSSSNGRRRTVLARYLGLISLLLLALLPRLANAQVAVPPPRQSIDDNGVDLLSGNFTYSLTPMSIGTGQGSLSYTMNWVVDGWRDSLSGGINADASGSIYIVSIGVNSESFSVDALGGFTNLQGTGSTLTQNPANFIYKTTDGMTATFSREYANFIKNIAANQALIKKIEYSDGRQLYFDYQDSNDTNYAVRLFSVKNNYGNEIKYTYLSNTFDPLDEQWLFVSAVTGIKSLTHN